MALGFSISIPDTWFEVDLNPVTRRASIDALVRERTRGVPELAANRAAISRLLRHAARDAAAGGALFCGVMAEAVEGAGLSASVTVSMLPAPDDARVVGVAEVTPSMIMSSLSERVARSQDDTWTTVTLVDLLYVGQAARSYGVEDISLPDRAGWIRTTMMQTFVPVPRSDQVALISCSSPNLVLVDALHDLFDAVTSTFRFVTDSG
ncbi:MULTISPECIES: hypothetical protein [Protofrankia]|uniref:Uncharacterized protein n=1 Tax=Candidatus Protofrankia datiscae TaxID=2716812 RepID=F8B135_9ACTN|nr:MULTISPECIES: hypothetical protein [Protofrankia]AEH07668.1 hypothetical protein FsymDg_0084 [Candidatus Protofrankia datiscae]